MARQILAAVIPGCASWRRPGIHNPRSWLWIPGSLASLAPRNDGDTLRSGASAVDGVGGARDVTCLVGSKERNDRSDLTRKPEPPRRHAVDDLLGRHRRVAGVA